MMWTGSARKLFVRIGKNVALAKKLWGTGRKWRFGQLLENLLPCNCLRIKEIKYKVILVTLVAPVVFILRIKLC